MEKYSKVLYLTIQRNMESKTQLLLVSVYGHNQDNEQLDVKISEQKKV